MTDGSPLPGMRERKKLATRHALSSAALQLAVERGLENVTIEDISAQTIPKDFERNARIHRCFVIRFK